MRAMTFERLVRDKQFASELTTTAVGRLNLARPTKVVIVNAHISVDETAKLLAEAHDRAIGDGAATMLHGLAIPFAGFERDARDGGQAGFRGRGAAAASRGRRNRRELADRRRREGLRTGPVADRRRAIAQGVPPGGAGRRVGVPLVAPSARHERAPVRRAGRPAQRVPSAGGASRASRRPPRGGAHARRRAAPRGRRRRL